MAVAHLIPDNVGATMTPVLILALGFVVSVRVGLVLVALTLAAFILLRFMMGEQRFMETYHASLEKLSAETVEYIRGMQVVKIFGVDVRSFKALNAAIKEYARNALNYSLSCKRLYVLFQALFLAIAAILVPAALLFTSAGSGSPDPTILRRLSLELIMAFFLTGVLYTYFMKVTYLSMYVFQVKDAVSKLETLYGETQEDALQFGDKTEFESHDIEFENVSSDTKSALVLDNLSFILEENRSYALVGVSGSGRRRSLS